MIEQNIFEFNEKYLSQIPALQLLMQCGYTLLSSDSASRERMGKESNIFLESVLREQLRTINRIYHKDQEFLFSEENIQSAIQKLKAVKFDGLVRTNEQLYDLLTLGTSLEQIVEGDTRSFTINYIDWKHWDRNVFHAVPEFLMERSRSTEKLRPDIVLFVNGIPLCVIECKAPSEGVDEAVSQSIRNQNDDHIPALFTTVQLLIATNRNNALYATVGTPLRFWSVWKEKEDKDSVIEKIVNTVLSTEQKQSLFCGCFSDAQAYFDEQEKSGSRLVTEQDRIIYSLCRPERLLELAYHFTLFDAGIKKIARYQQFFVIRSSLKRVHQRDTSGKRKGGIIWHTQGSGKSLTMVMLARSLAMDGGIRNARVVLVTDRDDLDRQLGNTFKACGLEPERASSGKGLLELIAESKAAIVTTLVHKFDKALNVRKYVEPSPDIFILIDEAHRSHYKSMNARMQQMLPNACYFGFTGTPLMKKEKNSFLKFGDMIEPHYSIREAVEDKAVVPLLYEGRMVELQQNKEAIDLWFERHTADLSKAQKADLKRKYAKANMLNKTEQVVYMQAFDISEHFRANWLNTGFKGQIVAPSRAVAVQFKHFLDELGTVTSEVIISGPDSREGYDDVDDEPDDAVIKFWEKMMKRFGTEEEYNKQIINQFKNGDTPHLLIVKDKLLTGFDAPRNTVLYLCRTLREHTLLQAIARVNRLYDKKDYGYIVDYANVLGELDTALGMYSAFDGFDPKDMIDTLCDIQTEIDKLPGLHSNLWELFKTIRNKHDEEMFEQLLANTAIRDDFYERLRDYSKCLSIALSSNKFLQTVDEKKLEQYKNDCKRFSKLRVSVRMRYAESVDYSEYEPRIEKMLNTHIQANEVSILNDPVNIFDNNAFLEVKEERGVYSTKTAASRADTIAHAVKRVITEKMEEDPAFYTKFSKMIQDAIDEFKAKRISDLEYLDKASEIRDKVINKKHDDLPTVLEGHENAQAYYGVVLPFFDSKTFINEFSQQIAADIAMEVDRLFEAHMIVHFWDNENAQKDVVNAIDDYLFDVIRAERGIEMDVKTMDELIDKIMTVARHRNGM